MKFRVKVDGTSYEVEVEPIETVPAGAALRVESLPVSSSHMKPPPGGGPKPGNGQKAAKPASPSAAATSATPPPEPPPPQRPPWHGLGVGEGGKATSPVSGRILEVFVKVGDGVKENEPLVSIELSKVYSMGERPLVGTVRASASGTVADLFVQAGDEVAFGQPLAAIG